MCLICHRLNSAEECTACRKLLGKELEDKMKNAKAAAIITGSAYSASESPMNNAYLDECLRLFELHNLESEDDEEETKASSSDLDSDDDDDDNFNTTSKEFETNIQMQYPDAIAPVLQSNPAIGKLFNLINYQ